MTERTATETERPGEGKTLGELAREAHAEAEQHNLTHGFHARKDPWQAAAEAVKSALIPCTFPSCLSAQTAASAGEETARLNAALGKLAPKGTWLCEVLENIWRAESKDKSNAIAESARDTIFEHGLWEGPRPKDEIARLTSELKQSHADIAALKAELSNLIAATKGQTFYHSDEAVNAEMGRLRGEVKDLLSENAGLEERIKTLKAMEKAAYQRGVEAERARVSALLGTAYAHAQQIATKGDTNQGAVIILIGELRRIIQMDPDKVDNTPAPQKNTAECQEVCEWVPAPEKGNYITGCTGLWQGVDEDAMFCSYCGKPLKVVHG